MNLSPPPHSVVGVDPGVSTGWVEYVDGKPDRFGVLEWETDIQIWLDNLRTDLFVVEDYIIRPTHIQGGYGHQWDKGVALQVIGAIRRRVHELGSLLVMQQPSIKPIASGQSGLPYKKGKKGMHHYDAMLHVEFWLRKNGHKIGR